MRLTIINRANQSIGGGWSFISNLKKGLPGDVELVEADGDIREGSVDVWLIPSASMITSADMEVIKRVGGKIVLRVDNALRNPRKRNAGMTKMRDCAALSGAVVFQSEWAVNYLLPYLSPRHTTVIYNGIDQSIFKEHGGVKPFEGRPVYLYSRYNRDETKRWEQAWYEYQMLQRSQPEAKLVICGRYSRELISGNFDFFNNEKYEYIGVISDPHEMAAVYRGCKYLLATYYNDCFSNTYLEALSCGVELYQPNLSGGTQEMINLWVGKPRDYFGVQRMANEYVSL